MTTDTTLRIVVGVDFTDAGDHALDEAIRYAMRLQNDELHPVFVIDDTKRGLAEVDEALSDARDRLRERVIARFVEAGARGEQPVIFHVRIGDPATVLHQVAVDVGASMIVVGTHGRGGFEKLLLGSVAQELVRSARLPILVARPNRLEDLPRTPAPDPADPKRDLHAPRVMSSELVVTPPSRPSHIAGLV
jgi:nucleotide-binding universal stress UspA family protein